MKSADRLHLAKVAELGCIACRKLGIEDSPPEIHHPRTGCGMGQRASHLKAIPLCHAHHRTGGHGVALHAGQKAFEAIYGTELELLAEVERLINGL